MEEVKRTKMRPYTHRGLWVGENSFPKPREVIIRQAARELTDEELAAEKEWQQKANLDERRANLDRRVHFPPRRF